MAQFIENPRQELAIKMKALPLFRWTDLIGAGASLLLMAPIFIFISAVIKFSSVGPPFSKFIRVGKNGNLFELYKFRTKYLDIEQAEAGTTITNAYCHTPVGRFLEKTRLEELPQLINVLRGEMGLVGPRPEDPRYVAQYSPSQRRVLAVRPGIISPSWLREDSDFLKTDHLEKTYQEEILSPRLALELAYLERRTPWTDLLLMLHTFAVITSLDKWLKTLFELRNRHFFVLDVIALLIIPALALTLRADGLGWWPEFIYPLLLFTTIALVVKVYTFIRLGLYRRYWYYASVNDMTRVVVAVGLASILLMVLFYGAHVTLMRHDLAMYRAVPILDGLLTGAFLAGFRFGLRGLYHWQRQRRGVLGGRRVLLVGAGEAGAMVVREMRANPQLNMEPIAFVDDDVAKVGTHIQGLPVLGSMEDIPRVVEKNYVQRIIVAIPSAPLPKRQEIIALCEQTGVATDNLPGIYELLAGSKTLSRMPEIDISHLLRRDPVIIEQSEVALALTGRAVLVTGAGGSIGSELCRQIAQFNPTELILLGHGENSIFEIGLDLKLSFPDLVVHPVIVDVRNKQRVNRVIETYRPDIIFHTAAHKHVPFMEANIEEAITNNIQGTHNVLQAAEQFNVDRFVLISTDKAINPTSIMGATKRMAELLVVAAAQRTDRDYIAVRFGNVLGSRGSVIPVFQQQIAAGGPLTVTHPDMRRYFMTIPEAVQLVLQSSVLGQRGEVFVLDMGQPVRILDLAVDLIKMSGLKPGRDIKIVYSGMRPGEKLYEELFLADEDYRRTRHPKIFVGRQEDTVEAEILEKVVIEVIDLAKRMQTPSATYQLKNLLPKICYYIDAYQNEPQSSLAESSDNPKLSSPDLLYPRPSALTA